MAGSTSALSFDVGNFKARDDKVGMCDPLWIGFNVVVGLRFWERVAGYVLSQGRNHTPEVF